MRRFFFIPACLFIFLSCAADSWPTDKKAHRIEQDRPIKLGTSGGNIFDSNKFYCCSGTLGALVTNSEGKLFVLSNNHVLAKENKASIGDPISQPGLIDTHCTPDNPPVATLSKFVKYRFGGSKQNKVDAAIAEIEPGQVRTDGKILEIGVPGQPVEATLGMLVKKSGRTSGKTVGVVSILNFTVRVDIPLKCGLDSSAKHVKFVDQMVIERTPDSKFLKAGDSGSLVVEKKRTCPGTVGLLFAGTDDGSIGVANRIQNVLAKLKVSIVGCGVPVAGVFPQVPARLIDPRILSAMGLQARYEDRLFRTPGILGVGVGIGDERTNEIGLVVFVQQESSSAASSLAIPQRIESLPVRRVITTPFKAL